MRTTFHLHRGVRLLRVCICHLYVINTSLNKEFALQLLFLLNMTSENLSICSVVPIISIMLACFHWIHITPELMQSDSHTHTHTKMEREKYINKKSSWTEKMQERINRPSNLLNSPHMLKRLWSLTGTQYKKNTTLKLNKLHDLILTQKVGHPKDGSTRSSQGCQKMNRIPASCILLLRLECSCILFLSNCL